ncbi:hypothetical protein ACFV3F_43695 [Streptomyces sp. NPDC059717]|uniref:hypothetical protein n=1 Tax=Streptomyces sp. NPDC059717 TaxID=3346922 RepID=UPI00368E7184
MDIPGWFVWIALGLAVMQALGLVLVVRRLRGSDSSVRFKARLDLLDAVGSMLLFGDLVQWRNPGSGSPSPASRSWRSSTP